MMMMTMITMIMVMTMMRAGLAVCGPTCLMKTVLPDPLGPETTSMLVEEVRLQSLGTKDEHEPSYRSEGERGYKGAG